MSVTSNRQATIEDVASAAGVSVATVSRALRDLPNVAPSTRDRVLEVARNLSYVANPTASRLAVGRTGTVAVLVPLFDSWYFAKIVAGIEAVLKDKDVDLLLYAVGNEPERQEFLAGRGAWWQRSDALVMVDVRLTEEEAARLAASGARIVTVGSRTTPFSSITLDEELGARKAVQHLLDGGHRRIGAITGDPHSIKFRVPILRLQGFRDCLAEAGITNDPELEQPGGFSIKGGQEGMAALLDHPDPPTAVFAMSDEMAFGALGELHRRGLRAPDDVAIVGFDNNDYSHLLGLTTVSQPVDTIGATAGRQVLRLLETPDAPVEHTVAATDLLVRETA